MAKPELDLALATSESEELISLIYNRYELGMSIGSQFMHTANNIAENTWEILKYKFAEKILTPNSTFLMIFGGSSVTAGHDNYYNQSFPFIFKKRMYPIFKVRSYVCTCTSRYMSVHVPHAICLYMYLTLYVYIVTSRYMSILLATRH